MAVTVTGCEQGDDAEVATTTESREAPAAAEFPNADGRTLGEIVDRADPPHPTDPVVTAAAQVFYANEPGESRYPILIADRDGNEITDAEVAVYAAPIPGGRRGAGSAFDVQARGPYPAQLVSLATEPEFRSQPPHEELKFATAFYLANIPFTEPGDWRVIAIVRHGDALYSKTLPSALVGEYGGIAQPGDPAPLISTPTAAEVDGDRSAISTRVPPSTLNETDFADVAGERPVALLFASPAYCQSRVCGPAVDVAEQVAGEHGDRVEFIQMEIYNGNDPGLGVRPQVRTYNLPSEPWLFVIDKDGIVTTAIEGAFGVEEMTEAVMEVIE